MGGVKGRESSGVCDRGRQAGRVGGRAQLGATLAWGGQSSPLKRRGWVLEWPLG